MISAVMNEVATRDPRNPRLTKEYPVVMLFVIRMGERDDECENLP